MSNVLDNGRLAVLTTRVARLTLLLVAAWVVMTFTHEMGHILGGWCGGGRLQSADLAPWRLPYSMFDPDPRPLVTLWCGPVLGVVVPLGVAGLLRRDWAWFIANFCVLANGAYLATAWWTGDRFLDTARLLEHGASRIALASYCVVTIGYGYIAFRRSSLLVLSGPQADEVKGT